jgi:hypothetical protein
VPRLQLLDLPRRGNEMGKLDYKKELKELYFPPAGHPVLVKVPKMNFLQVDGEGDPNTSQAFQEALEALYGVAYTVKFMLKKQGGGADYAVPPLEGLWYADDPRQFLEARKEEWRWTVMIMQPHWVTKADVAEATRQLREKKDLPALEKMRFKAFSEGKSAQVMHVGPFSAEGPTIQLLLDFIEENGLKPRGHHHEIYMSDFRRTDPAKLKTVIRHPVA